MLGAEQATTHHLTHVPTLAHDAMHMTSLGHGKF